jgi:23S rRNA (uracil1939-C5)-methyltransferase
VRYVAKKQRVLVGFNEKATPYVTDMLRCPVLPPHVSALILPLQECLVQLSIKEQIPQVEVAVGEQSTVLVLRILQALSEPDKQVLEQFADRHQVQIWTQSKGLDTVQPLYPVAAPALNYRLPEFDLNYPFQPTEFTQVNPYINQVMIRRAMQLLAPQQGERIADFFCGLGNFTLPIARSGAQVFGYEGLPGLVERAKQSAQLNGLQANSQFFVKNLFEVSPESLAALPRFDKWLLDPPRDGAMALVSALSEQAHRPQRIVYVSCNPATLARDAGILVHEKGYQMRAAGVINMFPHTAHIESIALFELVQGG